MKKKFVVLIAAIAMLFGVVAGVSAAPILEKISAHLNWSVKFSIGGKEWSPKDPNGNKLAPITYKGSNYLPVRAVAEAFDIAVDWDGNTNTIYLGEKTDSVHISDEEVKPDYASMLTTDKQYTVQDGQDYKAGIVMESINSAQRKTTLVSNNKYQKLELNLYGLDLKYDVDVRIYGKNDTVLQHVVIGKNQANDTVEIDIGGQNEITIIAKSEPGASEKLFVTGTYR